MILSRTDGYARNGTPFSLHSNLQKIDAHLIESIDADVKDSCFGMPFRLEINPNLNLPVLTKALTMESESSCLSSRLSSQKCDR